MAGPDRDRRGRGHRRSRAAVRRLPRAVVERPRLRRRATRPRRAHQLVRVPGLRDQRPRHLQAHRGRRAACPPARSERGEPPHRGVHRSRSREHHAHHAAGGRRRGRRGPRRRSGGALQQAAARFRQRLCASSGRRPPRNRTPCASRATSMPGSTQAGQEPAGRGTARLSRRTSRPENDPSPIW